MSLLTTIFGTKSGREIKKIQPLVNQINDHYDTLEGKDESYLVKEQVNYRAMYKRKLNLKKAKS